MAKSTSLGLPRIGSDGKICQMISDFIRGIEKHMDRIDTVASQIRLQNWQMQMSAGIDIIPCNDFSLYDHVLDTTALVGNIPRRYYWEGGIVPPEIYFSMVKGQQKEKFDVQGMVMRQWFDTGYFYVAPEIPDLVEFVYSDNKPVAHFLEAKRQLNIKTRPVLLGPMSYLLMGIVSGEDVEDFDKMENLDEILPVYAELFQNFSRLGVEDVQFDEPCLTGNLTMDEQVSYKKCYTSLREIAGDKIRLHLTTGTGSLGSNAECVASLPVHSVHIDCIKGLDVLDEMVSLLASSNVTLSLGLVSAADVWVNDLEKSIAIANSVKKKIGSDRIIIGPTSSMFLCPMDATLEQLPENISGTLSFVRQKLEEIVTITNAVNNGVESVAEQINQNKANLIKLSLLGERFEAEHNLFVKKHAIQSNPARESIQKRMNRQNDNLPRLPITSIGDFPSDSRLYSSSVLTDEMKEQMSKVIALQEPYIDIITCGEIERSLNEEYFFNLMDVYLTQENFVQISGDTVRRLPILLKCPSFANDHYLKIAEYCLSIAKKPIKFTLLGSVSLANACEIPPFQDKHSKMFQYFSIIVSDQIKKLEEIGFSYIGIHEPFLMKGISLGSDLAVVSMRNLGKIFKECISVAKNETQIHLDMKYLPFDEYVEHLGTFDADVVLLESSRSGWKILETFVSYKHQGGIGLGFFDPDSLRLPVANELQTAMRRSIRVLDEWQIWVSTDVGFKMRSLKDTENALKIISTTAREMAKKV